MDHSDSMTSLCGRAKRKRATKALMASADRAAGSPGSLGACRVEAQESTFVTANTMSSAPTSGHSYCAGTAAGDCSGRELRMHTHGRGINRAEARTPAAPDTTRLIHPAITNMLHRTLTLARYSFAPGGAPELPPRVGPVVAAVQSTWAP